MNKNQEIGVVDRIEGGYAVIVFGRESITIPRTDLPLDTKEGDSINLNVHTINNADTVKRKLSVRHLLDRIFQSI